MTTEITRAEFYAKYGGVQVRFNSYYKFSFNYEGVLPDGKRVSVKYGGDSDEIYRHEVSANSVETISGLQPYSGAVYEGSREVEYFYDY